jgi:hypothetical protein
MANKVGDDHRDDDGERDGKNDSQNSDPHASCGIIKAIKFAQHLHSQSCATKGSFLTPTKMSGLGARHTSGT